MVSRASPPGAKGLLASSLLGLAAALCLSSCAFFGRDMFPAELQYREASIDLEAALAKLGQSYSSVAKIERLSPLGGESRLFVLLYTDAGSRLAILDDDLEGIESLRSDSSLARFMLGDAAGGYACGTVVLSSDLTTASAAVDSYSDLTMADTAGYVDETTLTNVVLRSTGSSALTVTRFTAAWGGPTTDSLVLFSGDASSYYVADLLSLESAASFVLALLSSGDSKPRILVYANRSAFDDSMNTGTGSTYAASGARTIYLDFYLDDGRVWLTSDGAVALRNDDRIKRLSRVDYDDGEELDYLYLDDSTEDQLFSFEPEGKYWYRFDGKSGILYKLRTWW